MKDNHKEVASKIGGRIGTDKIFLCVWFGRWEIFCWLLFYLHLKPGHPETVDEVHGIRTLRRIKKSKKKKSTLVKKGKKHRKVMGQH